LLDFFLSLVNFIEVPFIRRSRGARNVSNPPPDSLERISGVGAAIAPMSAAEDENTANLF
jgi:hypothetical protein